MIKDKCCDDVRRPSDGLRIMATAHYPRGRVTDACDVFLPALAPDWALLQQFWSDKITWRKFAAEYRKKLRKPSQYHQMELLAALSERFGMDITVMCACEDRDTCHRSILVEEIRKSYRQIEETKEVFPYCIFHIKASEELERIEAAGGCETLVENGNWKKAVDFYHEAKRRGEDLLLLFDHADEFQGVSWTAVIDDISINHLDGKHYETSIKISQLSSLLESRQFPRSELILESTGQALDANHQRGYVLCHTPEFLR